MPDETPENLEEGKTASQDGEMDRQSESEMPLTLELGSTVIEKPAKYAKFIVAHPKTAFGKFLI